MSEDLSLSFTFAFPSPRIKRHASGYKDIKSSIQCNSLTISKTYSLSFPAVGRYRVIWIDFRRPGGEKTRGKMPGEGQLKHLMKGSKERFHRAIVPPYAFLWYRGSSLSCELDELRWHLYRALRLFISAWRSHWNKLGSLINIKSGEIDSSRPKRLNFEQAKPSILQVRHV